MTDATVTCHQCGKAATLGALDDLTGAAGDVELTIHHMPARVCPQDHRRLAYPEFAARLMDYLGDAGNVGVAAAQRKGWIRKRAICSGCGGELDGAAADARTLTLGVRLDSAAPFEVDLRLPVCTCPHCGLDQTPDAKLFVSRVPAGRVHVAW
ncbi:MAG: hypothetical protein ACOZDY_04785 [Pseudomonadota bacterium]